MGKAMPENLIPTTKRSPEDVKRITTMGGKASGESRRKRKLLRECLEELLARKWDTEEGKKTLKEVLDLDNEYEVLDCIAFGYPKNGKFAVKERSGNGSKIV